MRTFLNGDTGRLRTDLLAVSLLLFFFARLINTAAQKAATFDEPLHLLGSVVYWQHRPLLPLIDNPLLIHALIGLPLRLLAPLLPVDHPFWGERFATLALSTEFAWVTNDNGLLLVWVGRWVVVLLALLLAALAFRWSGRLRQNRVAALFTLFLLTFDPNMLAHASLATTDIGTTFFVILAAYLLWRYWQAPGRRRYLLAGLALGLALSSKYSALALFPAAGFMGLLWAGQSRPGWSAVWRAFRDLVGWTMIALVVLLAVQQFNLPVLLTNLEAVRGAGQFGHPTYLLGQINQGGWWFYFPVIFLAKTPVAVYMLLVLGLAVMLTRDRGSESGDGGLRTVDGGRQTASGQTQSTFRNLPTDILWPVLLILVWLAVAMVGRINVGYRQLLPLLPLLYVLLGQMARPGVLPGKIWSTVYGIGLAAFALASLLAHPHYLAYFNRLAGGPENGWRIAVDSNLDWGQDLAALAGESTPPTYTALFSTSPPSAYGVAGEQIPVWPLPEVDPLAATFYPPRPGAGRYAISATQLVGLYLQDPDTFAYFRSLEPAGRVGYSIFLYDVPPDGPETGLVLSGVGLPEMAPAVYDATIDSNQLTLRRYDARRSFVWPLAENHWAAIAAGHRPEHPLLAGFYASPVQVAQVSRSEGEIISFDLYRWVESPLEDLDLKTPPETSVFHDPDTGREALIFQGHTTPPFMPGTPLALLTVWQVAESPAQPFSLFLHLVNAQGEIVAQHDGWDIRSAGLAEGDVVAQLHQMEVPADLPAGEYFLRLGVYDRETGDRFTIGSPTGTTDFIQLKPIFVVESPP